eukprot:Nk52_evm25s554 gene=Nk52_evmTU25s554
MPLVVMCGYPCSGKSKRANELCEYLKSKGKDVVLLNDEFLSANTNNQKILDKNDIYSLSLKEKNIRGMIKANVEKHLSKEVFVICDFLNYIKGFRYELYCIVRSLKTTQCVINCDTSVERLKEWNLGIKQKEGDNCDISRAYKDEVIDGLVMRFEPPNDAQRWDSPLFNIQWDDKLPCKEIYDVLVLAKVKPPNTATVKEAGSSTNFLYELDQVTQDIINLILEGQKQGSTKVLVPQQKLEEQSPKNKPKSIFVNLCKHVTLSELRRIRRQFVSFTKLHNDNNASRIPAMFVDFVNNSLQE